MFSVVATPGTSRCGVKPSAYNELFARKYVTPNNEKGTEKVRYISNYNDKPYGVFFP